MAEEVSATSPATISQSPSALGLDLLEHLGIALVRDMQITGGEQGWRRHIAQATHWARPAALSVAPAQ